MGLDVGFGPASYLTELARRDGTLVGLTKLCHIERLKRLTLIHKFKLLWSFNKIVIKS